MITAEDIDIIIISKLDVSAGMFPQIIHGRKSLNHNLNHLLGFGARLSVAHFPLVSETYNTGCGLYISRLTPATIL